MDRTSYPSGQVPAAMAKALLSYLEARYGGAAVFRFLETLHRTRDDLEDETAPMPVATLRDALAAFAEVAGREAIPEVWTELVRPDNLGWSARVLRGARSPIEAYARMGAQESEYGRTMRWETLASGPGFWRGRVYIAHDPALEESGLLSLARAAELRAIPALFGYEGADVVARAASFDASSQVSQGYEVRWPVPRTRSSALLGALGGALAGTLAGASFGAGPAAPASLGVSAALAGAAGGVWFARDVHRRAEARAQAIRVQSLERSLALKERRERTTAGQLEGTIVAGQYRIKQRMGAGASGVIYEAERMRDGLPVAVKLLRAVAAQDAIASDRLRREAEALGLSWHPNVVERIDHGHLPDGTTFLVMELLHGETLARRIRARGRISPRETQAIALQICDALGAIHAAGVLHRDLKPSNIFLTQGPEGERVKIIDFGIARVEWEETRITNMGTPVGTPGYMAPEQEVGGTIDRRSDLYAVGAVIFECLVGDPPPPTPSGLWLVRPATPAEGFNVGLAMKAAQYIPAPWQALLDKVMARDPDERFQEARELAKALRELSLAETA
jgi:serine/threonine-protein kinase